MPSPRPTRASANMSAMICWWPRRSPAARAPSAATDSPFRIRAASIAGISARTEAIPWSSRVIVTCRSFIARRWRSAAPSGSSAWSIRATWSEISRVPQSCRSGSCAVSIVSTSSRTCGGTGPIAEPTVCTERGFSVPSARAVSMPGMLWTSRRQVARLRPATDRDSLSIRDASERATCIAWRGLSSRCRQSSFTAASRRTSARARTASRAASIPTMLDSSALVSATDRRSSDGEPCTPSVMRAARAAATSTSPTRTALSSTRTGTSAGGASCTWWWPSSASPVSSRRCGSSVM